MGWPAPAIESRGSALGFGSAFSSIPQYSNHLVGMRQRPTRLFVLTLGYSRKCVRLLAWRSSARIWAELHEKAFRRLGGCPRVVVLDFVPGNKIEIGLNRYAVCGSAAVTSA